MAKRSLYRVVFFGENGKRQEMDVEANDMAMIDSVEDSLVCFNKRNHTVFAIPFRNLIHAMRVELQDKQVTVLKRVK